MTGKAYNKVFFIFLRLLNHFFHNFAYVLLQSPSGQDIFFRRK